MNLKTTVDNNIIILYTYDSDDFQNDAPQRFRQYVDDVFGIGVVARPDVFQPTVHRQHRQFEKLRDTPSQTVGSEHKKKKTQCQYNNYVVRPTTDDCRRVIFETSHND